MSDSDRRKPRINSGERAQQKAPCTYREVAYAHAPQGQTTRTSLIFGRMTVWEAENRAMNIDMTPSNIGKDRLGQRLRHACSLSGFNP